MNTIFNMRYIYSLTACFFFYTSVSEATEKIDFTSESHVTGTHRKDNNSNCEDLTSPMSHNTNSSSLEPLLIQVNELDYHSKKNSQVKSLALYGSADENMATLSLFSKLEELNLSLLGNRRDTFSIYLSGLSTLLKLDLSSSCVSDTSLKLFCNLKSLKSLNLSHTRLAGQGLEYISSLTQLSSLDISHTLVGNNSVMLLEPLLNLVYLNLQNTRVNQENVHLLKENIMSQRQSHSLAPIEFDWKI